MSGARVQLDAGGTFTQNPQYTLFSRKYDTRDTYIAESLEIPFDTNVPAFGGSVSARIPPKDDLLRRLTLRSELPQLYTPLGPGYVYPRYSDEVDGGVYVQTNTLAIQPGDFVGYFNTQFLSAWATNFVGYSNINVTYDSTLNKFVFTGVYSDIFFQNEASASFWGFDIRDPDFFTINGGYPAYNFTGGTLIAPLTLVQAGWIRGFTPPPSNGFSYVDSVATKLVKNATLTVGGQVIDRLTSERLYLEQDLCVAYENQAALTILEGKNDMSVVSTPREYYTKLTFNMDTLNMSELYMHDVRVDIEYEKFENLAANVITSNGFLDGDSYVTSNLQAITADGTENFDPTWAIGWKNYVIMGPLLNNSFRFYNQDDGTFYKWTPGSGSGVFITTNGGTLYGSTGTYIRKALISTILSSSTTPWTTSTYSFFSAFPANGDGDGRVISILTDARYAYIQYSVNYYIIGSTYTSLVSVTSDVTQKIWTFVYRFYNTTAPLSGSDQTALQNFWTNNYGAFSSAVISSMVQSGSDVLVTGTLTYPSIPSTTQQNYFRYIHRNLIWMRYDTTADFNSSSSYTYALTTGGLPASIKDLLPGYTFFEITNSNFYLGSTFDGRYIYFATAGSYIAKLDTQSFLSTDAYTQVDGAIITPNPVRNLEGAPLMSDGRYLYFSSSSPRGSPGTFSRYDSTSNVDQQASWEFYTGDTVIRSQNFEYSIPCGFDGKYVYYHTKTVFQQPTFPETDFSRKTLWHKYDTTKPFNLASSWEWINFRINSDNTLAISGSDGSSPQIALLVHRTDLTTSSPFYNGQIYRMRFITGSRYIYITEVDGRGFNVSYQDFIQYNPVTMSNVLSSSSIIAKYKKYPTPPRTGKMLYGQTDVETFTIQPGAQTSEFQLRFLNPVRELWISVDDPCVIQRLILRLNGEILVDDDQVTTKTIRAFESHTYVSSNVAVVNFALDPEILTPSGSLNMSRIASPMLEIQLVDMPTAAANVRVYSKSYNVFQANNGIGGLLFNSAF
jgi:hypothetical protein